MLGEILGDFGIGVAITYTLCFFMRLLQKACPTARRIFPSRATRRSSTQLVTEPDRTNESTDLETC